MQTHIIHRAAILARNDLFHCNTPHGVIAGAHHFVDLWARDSLFATYGANVSGLRSMTKRTLETFLQLQRNDGLIPYRVMRSFLTMGKYRGSPKMRDEPVPNFRSHQSGGTVSDGGLLTVIAFREYIKHTKDTKFLQAHYPSLVRAMHWYTHRFDNRLISEWFLCEWADAVLKVGNTLYTNVLYTKALFSMSALATRLRMQEDAKHYSAHANLIHQKLLDTFWNDSYLSDWYDYRRQDYFSSHANFLAIIFDLVDRKKSLSILNFAKKHTLADFTMETNYPPYPFWRIGPLQWIVGMGDYHNRGCLWLQPGITYTVSLWNLGYKNEAREFLEKIAIHIVKYNGVYEVYEKDGSPIQRTFYTSEHPFAWSSGLYLWAYHILTS